MMPSKSHTSMVHNSTAITLSAPNMPEENSYPDLDEAIDHPQWSIIFALFLLVVYYFSHSIQYFLLSSIFKLTKTVPTEGFQQLLKLVLPTFTDLAPLLVIYLAITRFYKLPFWPTFGWSWSERLRMTFGGDRFSPRTTTLFAGIFLALASGFVATIIPGPPTTLDSAIDTSPLTMFGWMLSGVLTTPLLEELLFRGILYPALLKKTGDNLRGKIFAIAGTTIAFSAIHIRVYQNSEGVPHIGHLSGIALAAICFTLMRAYTKRLLPCYFLHLIFNLCPTLLITAYFIYHFFFR